MGGKGGSFFEARNWKEFPLCFSGPSPIDLPLHGGKAQDRFGDERRGCSPPTPRGTDPLGEVLLRKDPDEDVLGLLGHVAGKDNERTVKAKACTV